MYSQVISAVICGMQAHKVTVEADIGQGMPMFSMIGYLSSEVREAQDRVRTALRNVGVELPLGKITVNLAPADLRKEGAGFDLAIAMAVLAAAGLIDASLLGDTLFVGELGLDGRIEPVRGVIEIVSRAKEFGCSSCIIPMENLREGAALRVGKVRAAAHLRDVMAHFLTGSPLTEAAETMETEEGQGDGPDFCQIRGQAFLKRAAEVAVAGGHNLLIMGPPGSGKTMTAQRLPGIMPALTREEAIEITRIHSIAGTLPASAGLVTVRPFRAPHHTISPAGLAGGGNNPKPGEVSLAHRGILFLDELPEFHTDTLEILRQPMEDGQITISRQFGTFTFPSRFQLVASANPCRCGYYPDRRRCRCTPYDIKRYLSRISQPLLDRIDMCVEAAEMTYEEMAPQNGDETRAESSAVIRARIEKARKVQAQRFAGCGRGILTNAGMDAEQIGRYCVLGERESKMMEMIYRKLKLTGRGYYKMLKVSRTLADLDGKERIGCEHLEEAVTYKMIDRRYWGDL